MAEIMASKQYWKIALRVSLVVGGVFTLVMVTRHYLSARIFSWDLWYIGGMSFVMCTVPVFLTAWVLLGVFGETLLSASTE
jgi:hypothetical protein